MTSKKNSGSRDKRNGKRNKRTDADGRVYDRRSGRYGAIDEGIRKHIHEMDHWICSALCAIELSILNLGKPGRPFVYPPSLILFLDEQRQLCEHGGYRAAVAHCADRLADIGLPTPCYKTAQRSRSVFFGPDGRGDEVISEAVEALKRLHPEKAYDPLVFARTGFYPPFEAPPGKEPECQKDLDEQAAKKREAARLRRSMEVFVCKEFVGRSVEAAVDGSGIGTVGTGIYIEFRWRLVDRSFIKIHVMLDTGLMKVVAFSVTFESPGDSKVLPPLIEGAVSMGVTIAKVCADGAYDGISNWELMAEKEIEFLPNLNPSFTDDRNLPERRAQRLIEEQIGKTLSHKLSGYNTRWLVEAFFSVFKRLYGERVRDRMFSSMAITLRVRFALYNRRRGAILDEILSRESEGSAGLDGCLAGSEA